MKSKIKEIKFYGIHTCLRIFEKRPGDIIRVYLTQDNLSYFSPLLKWCAQQKKTYRIVPEEELCKITESTHHEGVCILAKEKPLLSSINQLKFKDECLLYLDGVENPHNIGSILRTCTHFGINYLLGEKGQLPLLSPSACRVAKGGSEIVSMVYLDNKNELKKLKEKGFTLIATDAKKGTSLYNYAFPKKTLLILGAEDKGISPSVMKEANVILHIPGTGNIESLNVSVATALFLGEYYRQISKK
jgi:TrmH RNA methyltransferase